ncbi:MAG: helix-turn-helix domain-containing protein [Caulobacterales bacterium]
MSLSKIDVVAALVALAHERRLSVFRLLVQSGPDGLSAGDIAARLKMQPSSLTFHTQKLAQAKLLKAEKIERQVIYSVQLPMMKAVVGYLTENCCGGASC